MGVGRRLLAAIFSSSTNAFIGIAALVLCLVAFYIVPQTETVRAAVFWTMVTIGVWIVCVLVRALLTAVSDLNVAEIQRRKLETDLSKAEAAQASPKVLAGFASARYYAESKTTLLVESTWYLSTDSLVTVFQSEEGVEREIAIGQVVNIQADRRVQIVLWNDPHNGDHLDAILRNDANVLKKLIVKPTVPSRIFRVEQNG